jgi:hypothetical protein
MPSPAELVGEVVDFVGGILTSSSLRFEFGPTLALLGVLLVFLQLVARPISRWASADPAGLGGVGRAMALAAESGTDAVVSLGAGGIARATDAVGRLQTLAALPVLAHIARASARAGVPLRVLTNDAYAGAMAAATLDAAHATTSTPERAGRSRIVVVGEGRSVAAGLVMTARARPAAAFAVGSLREEATLHLEGLRSGAEALVAGTAEGSQVPSVVLAGGAGTMLGAEPFQVAADLRADIAERTTVLAGNRLLWLAAAAIAVGSLLGLADVLDVRGFLLGTGSE